MPFPPRPPVPQTRVICLRPQNKPWRLWSCEVFGTLSPTHCTFSDIIAGPVSTRTHCIPLPARHSGLTFTPPVFAASHTILVRVRDGSCSAAFHCLNAQTAIWQWQRSHPRRIRPVLSRSRIYQHRQICTVALDAPMHTVSCICGIQCLTVHYQCKHLRDHPYQYIRMQSTACNCMYQSRPQSDHRDWPR